MKKWEDIIKDKLGRYESPLPEGSLAAFRAKRDGIAGTRHFPLGWVLAATGAAAMATVLLFRQPGSPEDSIRIIQQPVVPVAVIPEPAEQSDPVQPTPLSSRSATPKPVRQVSSSPQEEALTDAPEPAAETLPSPPEEEPVSPEVPETVAPDSPQIIPLENLAEKPQQSPFWSTTAGVLFGNGLLLASAITPTARSGATTFYRTRPFQSDFPSGASNVDNPSIYSMNTGSTSEKLIGVDHAFPLKLSLSTRLPVANRLYLTTGIEYAIYQSTFNYSRGGKKKQTAQYLGLPVRLDWLFASGKLLEAYIGGGVEGDFCVGASLDWKNVPKDGSSFSLVAASGIQMNVSRHLGLYIEPGLSWRFLGGDSVLETYRSTHPLMFSVTTGLRITFDHAE